MPRGKGVIPFAGATFVNSVGLGIYYPFSLLFFQSVLDAPLTSIGVCLTGAALVALPLLPFVGRLVDRFGPRHVLLVCTAVRAAAFASYLLVHSMPAFFGVSVLVALTMRTEQAATPVLATALAAPGPPARWLALSRALFNAGFGLGALVAGVAASAERDVLVRVGAANAVCIGLACLLYLALRGGRRTPAQAPARARPAVPWRDRPFCAAVAAGAGLWLIAVSIETALPVHLVRNVSVPPWTVSVLFALNTVLLAVFQVPVAHRLERLRPTVVVAVGSLLHIALLLALAAAGSLPAGARTAGLLAAMTVYTFGELIASQALLTRLTALAPPDRQGAYLAFNQLFIGLANALTPLVVTSAMDHSPGALWGALTVCALAVAALMAVAARTRKALVPA
ncbi:MFS transporter [Streptomyces sp. NPDC047046]|uniref:MFS transporter n=1 Tax=Streptomyces sp. NPDC047046 TaxID=3155378 RepID=UPI0033D3319B